MEGIPISEETLNEFRVRNDNYRDRPGEPGIGDESTAIEQLNEVAGWLLKTADTALGAYVENAGGTPKEVEKVKWDDESRKRASELSVIVAERNISRDVLRNSPELFLGTLITSKLVEFGIVISQINKRQANVEPAESKKDGEDE